MRVKENFEFFEVIHFFERPFDAVDAARHFMGSCVQQPTVVSFLSFYPSGCGYIERLLRDVGRSQRKRQSSSSDTRNTRNADKTGFFLRAS